MHLDRLNAGEMAGIIDAVCERIDAVVAGNPGRVSLAGSYETLAEEAGVWVIVEHHPLARARAVVDGAEVVVALRPGPRPHRGSVSLAKASPYVDLDLEEVYAMLNDEEGITSGSDRWGGSDLVGGSPRESGTRLPPTRLCECVAVCYGRPPATPSWG
jgi:DNA-binding transcriptional LysR family regulator